MIYTKQQKSFNQHRYQGKGRIKTYFLIGKDGLDLEMADLNLAAPLADHEFK